MKNNHASPKATLRHRLNQLPRRLRYGMRAFIHKHTPDYFPIAYKLALIITLLISAGMVILGSVIVTNQTQLLRSQINDFGQAVVSQLGESSKELVLSDDILSLMVVISNLGTTRAFWVRWYIQTMAKSSPLPALCLTITLFDCMPVLPRWMNKVTVSSGRPTLKPVKA